MLSNVPSLRQILTLECPFCSHIITQSEREEEYYCVKCGHSLGGRQ